MSDVICYGDHRDANAQNSKFRVLAHIQLRVPEHAEGMVETAVTLGNDFRPDQTWKPHGGIDKFLWDIPSMSNTIKAVYSHDNHFFGIYVMEKIVVIPPKEWYAYILNPHNKLGPLLMNDKGWPMRFPTEQAATDHLKHISGTSNWRSYYRAVKSSECPHLKGIV